MEITNTHDWNINTKIIIDNQKVTIFYKDSPIVDLCSFLSIIYQFTGLTYDCYKPHRYNNYMKINGETVDENKCLEICNILLDQSITEFEEKYNNIKVVNMDTCAPSNKRLNTVLAISLITV